MAQETSGLTKNEIFVVTGLGIGEETKSQTVEWLAWQLMAHTILRTGGWQAGHHVVREDGTEQMFSFFGAGTFEGARTHLKHMVISPVEFFDEAVELESKGIKNPFDSITIDKDCLTTTPFHGAISRFREIMRNDKKGTVGKGVGDAIKDANAGNPDLVIRAGDFLGDRETLKRKVEAIRQHKIRQAAAITQAMEVDELPDEAYSEMKILHDSTLVESTVDSMQYLADLVKIVDDTYFDDLLAKDGVMVTETSHGALLHPRYGFVPHVTQVDPTAQDLLTSLKEHGYKGRVVRLGVSRCYMTRHGAGPLVSFNQEMTDSIQETHNAASERANEWLGEFRNGNYDVVAMEYAIAISGGRESFDGLKISYLDVLAQQDEWQVCEAYTFEGEATDLDEYFVMQDGHQITGIKVHEDMGDEAHFAHQIRLTELLKQCTPVLKTLKPEDGKSLEDVFLDYVEAHLQLPVVAVAHGPKKEDRHARPGWEHLFKKPGTRIENTVEAVKLETELQREVDVYRPFGVDFYFAGQETQLPQEIATHPKLLKEAAQRRELNQLLATVFNKVADPTMNFDKAMEEGLLTASEVETIYQRLANFIKADENHGRIILYLPAQLLPHLKSGDEKNTASMQFAAAYKDAWLRLMYESEPRASYIDGDVLEEDMGASVRVRKAGHLIPDMLEHSLIDFSEVGALLEISDEAELLESLTAGIVVARDKKIVSDAEWQALQEMATRRPEIARVLTLPINTETQNHNDLQTALATIETQYAPDSAYVATISPERAKWEKQVKFETALDNEAAVQAQRVQSGTVTIDEVFAIHSVVGIKTVTRIGEQLAKTDVEQAQTFAQQNQATLEQQWQTETTSVKDAILTGLSHWKHLGIIDVSYLETFVTELPDSTVPFPIDLEKRQTTDFAYATEAVKKIQEHSVLSQYLYPIVVEVGSRIKGQAGFDTDYDGGIVFRPETPWEKRVEVLQILRQDVPELERIEKPLEFWLSQTDTGYGLKTAPSDIRIAVSPAQVHFFLNGVWVNQAPEFKTIYGDFLRKYVDLSRFADQKEEVRRQLLRQMELDMVQYRLLHKGYRRFYPSYKAQITEHANLIDWNSDFWDPGYRRIATQLFINRVFLPDLASS